MNRYYEQYISDNSLKRFMFRLPAYVWQSVFLGLPLVTLFLLSIIVKIDSQTYTFSLSMYAQCLNPVLLLVIFRSLFLAVSTAVLAALCAYPVAYWFAIHANEFIQQLRVLLFIPFTVNLLIHLYAWSFLLSSEGLLNRFLQNMHLIEQPLLFMPTHGALQLLMLYSYLPFMLFPLLSVMDRFDRSLLEASKDLGATSWQTFLRVVIPLSFPGLRVGFFLVLVPAFGEYALPQLAEGDRYLYVGSLIVHYFLVTHQYALGAAFTIVSLLSLALFVSVLHYFYGRIKQMYNWQGDPVK